MGFKLVIGDPKSKKCIQKEISDENAKLFYGKKIGDVIKGEIIDMTGYEFQITGGSDFAGFPMRKDNPGILARKIFITKGVGFRGLGKGVKKKKRVAGNTIYEKTAQVNVKVIKYGPKPLFEEKQEQQQEQQKNN